MLACAHCATAASSRISATELLSLTWSGTRVAKRGATADNSEVDTSGMARVANSVSRFCP